MNNQVVKFQGNELAYCWFNDEPYISIKHICEAIGIGYGSALQTLKNDEILTSVMTICPITASDKKQYDMQCLPLSYLNGWLFSISTEKVSEQARAVLLAYKRECYRVLHEHFFGRQEAHEQAKSLHHQILVIKAELKLAQNAHKNSETAYRVGELKTELQALEAQQSDLNIERYGKPVQLELLSSPTV